MTPQTQACRPPQVSGLGTPGTEWYTMLPSPVRDELDRCMTRRSCAAGQTIYLEGDRGDAMYRIVSGRVRIRSVSACGREVLMVIYGAGHCIGTLSVLDGLPRHNDAVTECDTVLDVLQAADFHRVARSNPEVYKAVAISYAMWIRDHQAMFVGGSSLEERLAHRIDFLLDFGAARKDESGGLRLDFTQEMLASSVAVSRQAISKLLQTWQDSGVIEYKYGSVRVLDRPQLRRLATGRLN